MNNKWKIGYFVATYILALIAISGFVFSIITFQSTSEVMQSASETLKDVQQEFAFSNQPFIRYDNYKWFKKEGSGDIACDNLPVGILITYRNFSNVPIIIHNVDAQYFYGEKLLDDIVFTAGTNSSTILPPGEVSNVGTAQSELFQKYLGNQENILKPPFLKTQLNITFSRLDDSKRFVYKAKINIGFNCSNLKSVTHLENETIEAINLLEARNN